MKKYLPITAFFLLGNEVVSWITLVILAVACLVWFGKEAEHEASRPRD